MANSQVERLSNPEPTIQYNWKKIDDGTGGIIDANRLNGYFQNYGEEGFPKFTQNYSSEEEAIKDFSRVSSEYLKLFPETFNGFDLILVKSYRFDTFNVFKIKIK